MKHEHDDIDNTSLFEQGADRRHYAALVIELADQVTVVAKNLAIDGRDSETIHTLYEELGMVQEAMTRSVTKLNNATVQEFRLKERAGMV